MEAWSRCSACKRDIGFGAVHWVCSVSTCNRRNTDYTFCSVACWDSHVATLRHRDAWAVEAKAPTREAWQREQDGGPKAPATIAAPAPAPAVRAAAPAPGVASGGEGVRRVVAAPVAPAPSAAQLELAEAEQEILIVVSKMKKYIRDRSGMNTSDQVADALSAHVRAICDESIRNAAADGRKTVLDRDVPRLPRR
ncbi:MAG TPA: hypothetical protein VHE35_35055 [Kofleriaceae bacterium]|nr:hypothetical protein [Kofleriaceae bacterium]